MPRPPRVSKSKLIKFKDLLAESESESKNADDISAQERIDNPELQLRIFSEASFNKLITNHFEYGFIVITAAAPGISHNVNEKNEQLLKQQLKNSPFSYLPVVGAWKDEDTNIVSKEYSFLVSCRGRTTTIASDWNVLLEFGQKLCGEFNQKSFLSKPPNNIDKNAYYIDRNGNVIETFSSRVLNNPSKLLYTYMKGRPDRRFTMIECLVPISPDSPGERNMRLYNGEIVIQHNTFL